jgi:hypothetical protein
MLEFDQTAAVLRMQFAVGSMMLDLAHACLDSHAAQLHPALSSDFFPLL